jgi:hypothetical protein
MLCLPVLTTIISNATHPEIQGEWGERGEARGGDGSCLVAHGAERAVWRMVPCAAAEPRAPPPSASPPSASPPSAAAAHNTIAQAARACAPVRWGIGHGARQRAWV